MYLVKMPKLLRSAFPSCLWSLPTDEKILYLTFDDGPIPEITPWVLETLQKYDAKATFFCVGANVRKYPDVFDAVLAAGHRVGNHTLQHLDGWLTDNIKYFHDVRHCASLVKSDLFRPPYGHLTPKQIQFLTRHYQIVMWDVLSGDFDQNLSPENCAKNVLSNASEGSIIVFHDSIKAWERMKYALVQTLEHFSALGYRFEALPAVTAINSVNNRTPQAVATL